MLTWQTATETNCVRFDIQHSADGYRWENIGEMDCEDFSNTLKKYQFLHQNPLAGHNFYRLRQMDADGHGVYTKVLILHWDTRKIGLRLQANMPQQMLYMDITGTEPDPDWQIELYAADGRLVQRFPTLASAAFALPNLNAGVYVAHLKDSTGRQLAIERLYWLIR